MRENIRISGYVHRAWHEAADVEGVVEAGDTEGIIDVRKGQA